MLSKSRIIYGRRCPKRLYLEAIHPETSIERRKAIERDLSAYCERDTFAMVRLAQFLEKRC